jgi:hypothetical protein
VIGYHNVQPYRRKDGTRVRGHKRRNPSPRIGAWGVLLFVALLVILGSLAQAHSSGSGQGKGETTQHSAVTSAKTP